MEEEEDENDISDDDDEDDIYFIDELGNVVFPVEDDVVEFEEECFTDGATGAVAVSGGGAQWCSCLVSDGMASPELRRQSQVRETSLGDTDNIQFSIQGCIKVISRRCRQDAVLSFA